VNNMPNNVFRILLVCVCVPTVIEKVAADEGSSEQSKRARGTDWPRFLGPTADGKSSEIGILQHWPASGPPLVWQRKLQESYGIGCVDNGRYYQFDREDDQAVLLSLDATSGREQWRFRYPTDYEDLLGYNNGPRCSPVVDGDRIYLAGAEGMLYCISTTGKLIWKTDTVEKFGVVQNFFGVGSTPAVFGDLLIVNVGGSPPESNRHGRFDLDFVRGDGSGVVAFDKMSGEVKYQVTDELASYASPKLATIDGRPWCFVFARGGLIGLDPRSGKVDFHYPWRARPRDSVNASTPVVVGDEVLISECYGPGSSLLKVRPGGCEVVWKDPPTRDKAMLTHWNTPIYHNGYLYGSSGRHPADAELRCIEWKTGKVKWSEPGLLRLSLLYADGCFVVLSENGVLRLIRATAEKYELVSEVELREPAGEDGKSGRKLLQYPAWAAPILSHGLLYVRGRDRVVCLNIKG
jgi:outer membrane protein assembly factor BamB